MLADVLALAAWSPLLATTLEQNPEYLSWALRLTRPGSVIVADNVIRAGAITDGRPDDVHAAGARRFLELVGADPRLAATAIQTVGAKGWDGFALAVVVAG